MVHFLLAEELVRERESELRRIAARIGRPPREQTRRQRLGWFLVEAGLRLTSSNAVAARRAA